MATMQSRPQMMLADADLVASSARAEALEHGWHVAITVVDGGGHPLSLQRLDGCPPACAYIALEKARTAALSGKETKAYQDMIQSGNVALVSITAISTLLEGGIPILVDGHCIGAIGVSGAKAEQDAQVARSGASVISGPPY
jgi:glc operon protein GlcG